MLFQVKARNKYFHSRRYTFGGLDVKELLLYPKVYAVHARAQTKRKAHATMPIFFGIYPS